MQEPGDGHAGLPAYARLMKHDGAPIRRAWLNLMLRLLVKRSLKPGVDIARLRVLQAPLDQRFARPDPQARFTPVSCAGVAAQWIDVPESRPRRVIFYLHGGGFMFRFPNTHGALVTRWCRRLGARALMVDYRLAPEHRYPAGADDCEAAYRWLLAQGFEGRNIVIGGDSAGGNLLLATLHRLKTAAQPLPACAVAISPFVDFTLSGESLIANEARDPMFTLKAFHALRPLYVDPEQMLLPDVSPLFADFSGLPPILFQASNSEMLRDDALRSAQRAHAQGVAVELELWENLPHVFQALHKLPQAQAALDSIVRFVSAHAGWAA